jgi:hypothetical protein
VKLVGTANARFQFQLASREKDLLLEILRLYPRIPPGHQPLSKAASLDDSSQKLLDDALAETRSQNKKELEALLADAKRLKQQPPGWRLALSSSELEWLLQVLNDIRVGSWIQLGSPEVPLTALNAETAPHLSAMEIAGAFQMRFLELLES